MAYRALHTLFQALLGLVFTTTALAADFNGVDHREITLWSDGIRLQGDIYKPKGLAADARLPGILLVHGWGGTKDHLQLAYGPQFARQGFVVLAFDFKGWGESDGPLLTSESLPPTQEKVQLKPEATHIRQVVDPLSMLEDARAALHYLVGEPQVQPDNIGIWGTSLGGGLALVTAANDPRIRALVDQVGAVNTRANLSMIAPAEASQWETLRARGEIPPYPGPESANPALKGFPDYIRFMRYTPEAYWDRLQVPTLIIDAEEEELFDRNKNGAALYESIKDRVEAEYLVLPGKHYAIYRDQGYRRALKAAQDWFVTHLKGPK